ncbi:MAG: DUF1542 domain-containing protein [Nanoarchaeota archaeon]
MVSFLKKEYWMGKDKIKDYILLILALVSTFFIISSFNYFFTIENIVSNFIKGSIFYIVSFTVLILSLNYLYNFYTLTLLIIPLISLFFIIKNPNNFLAYFLLFFPIVFYLLKAETCIDKFIRKISIARFLAFFISLFAFFFFMNTAFFSNYYKNITNSQDINKLIDSQIDSLLPLVINNPSIQQTIEKQKEEYKQKIIEEFEKQKQLIIEQYNKKVEEINNNPNLSEEEKQALIAQAEEEKNNYLSEIKKQEEEALKQLNQEFNTQLNNIFNSTEIKQEIKNTINNLTNQITQNPLFVKIATLVLIFSIFSFLNTIVMSISIFLIILIDFIISKFNSKEIPQEKSEL